MVVADGFTGNLILKTYEGVAKVLMNEMKGLFKKNAFTLLSALGVSGGLKNMKTKFDYKEYGGAVMLGVQKPVVKAHGSADARTFKNAIKQAVWFCKRPDRPYRNRPGSSCCLGRIRGSSVMESLEHKIGYTFQDRSLLQEALTHSSYANERHGRVRCNERMEFLGDAVLSIVSAELLYTRFPDMPEGQLSKLRSALVCTQSLAGFAAQIDLGSYLRMGKGEIHTKGWERPSTLENTFEALIAAIYLDGGMESAKRHILRFLVPALENHTTAFKDYKTTLQEVVQQNPGENVTYVLVGESGPDHDKRFQVQVRLNSNVIGSGVGRSKKEAEQEAAKEALHLMGL